VLASVRRNFIVNYFIVNHNLTLNPSPKARDFKQPASWGKLWLFLSSLLERRPGIGCMQSTVIQFIVKIYFVELAFVKEIKSLKNDFVPQR